MSISTVSSATALMPRESVAAGIDDAGAAAIAELSVLAGAESSLQAEIKMILKSDVVNKRRVKGIAVIFFMAMLSPI